MKNKKRLYENTDRYDKYGIKNINGSYDAFGKKIKRLSLFKKLSIKIHNYKQSKMIIPTDLLEIKRRANQIRNEIEEQKRQRIELASLNEDLELIKFHARLKGKLKHDDSDYQDKREKQDTKDIIDSED